MNNVPIIINRNLCHFNYKNKGFPWNLIDHIRECKATPIVIAALITQSIK